MGFLAGCAGAPPGGSAGTPPGSLLRADHGGPPPPDFTTLAGWQEDDHAAAVPALLKTCRRFENREPHREVGSNGRAGTAADWRQACAAARSVPPGDSIAARRFFEQWFTPVTLTGSAEGPGLFTGYYESTLHGSWHRTPRFNVPLYRMPTGKKFRTLPSRARIAQGALAGKGLELLWVDDPIEAFFLEIQGSGRIIMADGSVVSVGYAGQNGHPYYPIGKYLIAKGATTSGEVSMAVIRRWLKENPQEAQKAMNLNQSYVFFRLRPLEEGPRGAANVPLTPGRSMAVDPQYIPMGVPLWLDAQNAPVPGGKLRRLVVAQDTGGAIKGPVRGDLFWGHGEQAASNAGEMKARGSYVMLVPRSAVETTRVAARP